MNKKLSLILAIALLAVLATTQTALAYEPLDSLAPPDYKYYVYDNFWGPSLETWWHQGYPQGLLTVSWQQNLYNKWVKLDPYFGIRCQYISNLELWHPTRNYVALTWKLRRTQAIWQDSGWFIGFRQIRNGHEYMFGWQFLDTQNTKAQLRVTEDGFMKWQWDATVGPGFGYWFYYRIILGYTIIAGSWHSWVWFYLGEVGSSEDGGWGTPNTWFFAGETDLSALLGWGGYLSGSGVCDYGNSMTFIRYGSNTGIPDPDMSFDFVAKKCGEQGDTNPGFP